MTVMSPKLPARAPRAGLRSPPLEPATNKHDARKFRVYLHCSHAGEVFLDACGIDVEDLVEAHAHAAQVVRAYVGRPTLDDWRGWALHVSDAEGEDLFLIPFAAALGRPQ
jgi:hypothetical protein